MYLHSRRYLGTCTFQHGTASCTAVRVLYNISTAILQSSYLGKATASRLAAPPVTPAPPAPPQWALCSHLDHLVHAVEVGATTDLCLVRAAAGAAVTLLWRRSHRPEGVPAKTSVPCLEPCITRFLALWHSSKRTQPLAPPAPAAAPSPLTLALPPPAALALSPPPALAAVGRATAARP